MNLRALLLCLLLTPLAGVLPLRAEHNLDHAKSLDDLLQAVMETHAQEKKDNAERLAKFQSSRDQQAGLLAAAKAQLAAEQARNQTIQTTFDANETRLAEVRAQLKQNAGAVTELHGVARQVAGDVKALLDASMISVQFPGRAKLAGELAVSEALPTIEQLEGLWQGLLTEIIESGKVVKFDSQIIAANGREQQRAVTRLGVFNATSDGRFLRFAPDIQRLVEPPEQPEAVFQRMAKNLEQASPGTLTKVAFDPTRGAMLALLAQKPTLWQRIQDGRLIGAITILLGVVAIVITVWRYALLARIRRRVERQLEQREAYRDNPLGRVLAVFQANPRADTETLGLKLDEAVMRELPALQRGLAALLIIAEASPLLGLLGTVSGMITTFQALTLFGAGDAKVVAGGISEALVTTVLGLVVAIPTLVMHSLIKTKSDYLVQVLDEQSAGLVAHQAEALAKAKPAAR